MNRLNIEQRAKILGCMVEGTSVRATARLLGVDKKTVLRLLGEFGEACRKLHDEKVRNVKTGCVQADEIWSFCYAKEKNVPEHCRGVFGFGDVWTWTALCADTKLMVAYRVDRRDEEAAYAFIHDLRARLANRVQLSTDGLHFYLNAVEDTFGGDIDYAMIHKLYANPRAKDELGKYSPGVCCGVKRKKIIGNPAKAHISTSYVERMNLNIRMGSRRFTRLTNAFSKKVENHAHAIAIYFAYYNFCRIHQTLRITPAMEAGLTDHVWTIEELASLAEPARVGVVA